MTNINEFIQELLFVDDSDNWEESTVGAFLVHSSIFDHIKVLPEVSIQNIWDYELQIGETCHSMKLIYVNSDRTGSYTTMWNLCRCDVSFPWEENLTLFVPVKWFSLLERFIQIQRIDRYVQSIEDRQGISATNEMIRIVRFRIHKPEKLYLAKMFRQFLAANLPLFNTASLYCKVAFPWLQPWAVQHFDVPINMDNPIYAVIPIIFDHSKEFANNLFDLVAARMAFCDCRNLQPTIFAQSAIDRVIVRSLQDSKYNKNKGFDFDRYMFDTNTYIDRNDMLISYFVYVFQHFLGPSVTLGKIEQCNTIKLTDHCDVPDIVNLKSNLKFKIDGLKFNGMTFNLFNDLAACHNVTDIILDTNYRFIDNSCDKNVRFNCLHKKTNLYLLGKNTENFVEEFIGCLKKFPDNKYANINISLYIDCQLSSYLIFNTFPIVALIFRDCNINTQMLGDIYNCPTLTGKVSFSNCKFENKLENWIFLFNLEQLRAAEIQEEDNTWESIYDFVGHFLSSSVSKEFQIKQDIFIRFNPSKSVNLCGIKFSLDANGTKLQILNDSGILDLYNVKFEVDPDENYDYEFYQ